MFIPLYGEPPTAIKVFAFFGSAALIGTVAASIAAWFILG